MSAINANIVVEPINLNVTDTSITQTIAVDPISLSVFSSGVAQQNAPGGPTNTSVASGTLTFTNLANLKIDGGLSGYQLTTDGAGVLSWTPGTSDPTKIINGTSNVEIATVDGNVDFTVGSANVARMSTTGAAYPGVLAVNGNITAKNDITAESGAQFVGDAGGLSNVTATDLNATSTSNIDIGGGTNGYVLGTDGAGTLTWVAQGGAGTGNPGGSNTNIQFNDAGLFGGDTSFTFNKTTDTVTVDNITATGLITGDGGGISNIQPANIVGLSLSQIANGTSNVDIAAVNGNISLGVNSTADVVVVSTSGLELNTGIFTGDGSGLTNLNVDATQPVQLLSITGGAYNYDVIDGDLQYSTAPLTSNISLNFRGNTSTTFSSYVPTAGTSVTTTLILENDSTLPNYGVTSIDIDGVAQTINWVDGLEPPLLVFNTDSFQSYQFTIIRTAAPALTYTVFASLTRFGGT
jgi:hypothetical protein